VQKGNGVFCIFKLVPCFSTSLKSLVESGLRRLRRLRDGFRAALNSPTKAV
jgi:hypothetical protein